MRISENLIAVREKIQNSAVRAKRTPQDIKLVAVTKTIELPEIIEAVKAGVTILGENRVQEAQKKITDYELRVPRPNAEGGTLGVVEWHLIGNLQKNKAKAAVRLFDLIHSVDSVSLAEEINRQSQKAGKRQRVLIQVKLSYEATKHGVAENELMTLLERIKEMDGLKPEGLMTIPPFFEDPEAARPFFIRLRKIREKALAKGITLPELSMGMSNDFEVAIEEGSTMVRIGTAIFGERN
ncbi:MAG: YggS family pyridoxal phosphate-dependent enzyme [Nitrospiraceae bacterium]|nr:MAG: YggS family pyridoxal phosphate-dependent enzyme [Nitrospiraceae bacterium]